MSTNKFLVLGLSEEGPGDGWVAEVVTEVGMWGQSDTQWRFRAAEPGDITKVSFTLMGVMMRAAREFEVIVDEWELTDDDSGPFWFAPVLGEL